MNLPEIQTLPPGEIETAGDGGVGTQSAEAVEQGATEVRDESISAQVPSDWPEWAPALPTDIPPTPWEAEGRKPRPDELLSGADTPARSPADYKLPAGLLGDAGPEALAHGRAVQSLLWHADLPAHSGMALLEAIKDAAAKSPGELDDVSFELKARETDLMLKRQMGEPEYTRCRAVLAAMFERINGQTGGKLADFLDDHAEALLDPMVQLNLLMHAGRAEQRKRRG